MRDNAVEKLRKIDEWLSFQDEAFCRGIKSISDIEKLYDYARRHPDIDEFADTWKDRSLIAALGYDLRRKSK